MTTSSEEDIFLVLLRVVLPGDCDTEPYSASVYKMLRESSLKVDTGLCFYYVFHVSLFSAPA